MFSVKKGYSVSEAAKRAVPKVSPGKQNLAVKLLTYVLLFSSLVTFVTSSYIIYSDYRQGTQELNQSITQIKAGYQESISYSLWNFDSPQIKAQLAGILNFPGVLNVYIETKEGLLHSAGDFEQTSSQTYAFDLFFTSAGRKYPLGILNINLDYQGLYDSLFHKAFNILVTQFVKTFSVSLFILFIFQRLVTHRLLRMSQWASRFSLNNLDYELSGPTATSDNQDEIDSVINAINTMRTSLKADIKKRELVEQALKKSQDKLSIAINNAELGFCEYSQKTDCFLGNMQFAKHLEIDPAVLKKIKNPIDWFKTCIIGERAIEQRERINQLLHGHMERIYAELSLQCGNTNIKHFDTTIQVSEWDDNGLPMTIIFCLLDKTEQVNSSKQAADLNFALEQKVTRRTEELTNKQIQSNAELKKLQLQLKNLEQQKKRQQSLENQRPLHNALLQLNEFIHLDSNANDNPDQQQAKRLISLLSKHLEASTQLNTQTFDVVTLIQKSLQEFSARFQQTSSATLQLPFSLMLDSQEHLLAYCFEHCLITIAALNRDSFSNKNLKVTLRLEGDDGIISLAYTDTDHSLHPWDLNDKHHPANNEILILKMCHAMVEEHFHGAIIIDKKEAQLQLTIRFSIDLPS